MSDYLVEVENVSKRFRRGEYFDTLRDTLPGLARRLRGVPSGDSARWFWALQDVSFKVKRGEVLGIIGANGAGKSTLLKILARIIRPTTGRVMVRGRLRALIEIAAGFHPDLTGRENIFLNGAILGMKLKEIEAKFDEIVDFAGIGPFLDTPVKRYSSGMFARLGFSVAAHLEPDILIVDEVLAVGDAAFQAKCLGKMRDVAGQGRTVVFVSHNLRAVIQLCHRALLLDGGRIITEGSPAEVVEQYLRRSMNQVAEGIVKLAKGPDGPLQVNEIRLISGRGEMSTVFPRSQPVTIEILGEVLEPRKRLIVAIDIKTQDELTLFRTHSFEQEASYGILEKAGPFRLTCTIPENLLPAGRYQVGLILAERAVRELAHYRRLLEFDVFQDEPLRGSDIMATVGLLTPECLWQRLD